MSQTPEGSYDWLFEGQARTTGPAPTESLPPPNLPTPGSGRRPPRRPMSIIVRLLTLLIVIALAWGGYLVAVPAYALTHASRVDAVPSEPRPVDQPGTTYLIVGSDSRRGLTPQQRRDYATGGDVGARTDTIMLLHTGAGPATLVSVPRDSLVDIPGYGSNRINAAYAFGGAKLLVKTIENSTGIRIDDYVEIGFGGLVNVVDAVGGIEICPKTAITDPDAALKIPAGCQWVDGKTALGYSRSRHTYLTQDIERVQAQREVIGGIAHEVKSRWTFLNPIRYWNVVNGGAQSVQIGENVGAKAMADFALAMSAAMTGEGLNCTVPLGFIGNTVDWDTERAPAMFAHITNDTTDQIGTLCTKDGLAAQ